MTTVDDSLFTGLESTNGMRQRGVHVIRKANTSPEVLFLLITAEGGPRKDGVANHHRIYERIVADEGNSTLFFRELDEPAFYVEDELLPFVFVADLDGDGDDDVLMCFGRGQKRFAIYIQEVTDPFFRRVDLALPGVGWIYAAVLPDDDEDSLPNLVGSDGFDIYIYHQTERTIFDFEHPLSHFGPFPLFSRSFAIFDSNGDGILDFYVVQADFGTWNSGDKRTNFDLCQGDCPPEHPCSTTLTHANDDFLFIGCGSGRFLQRNVSFDSPGCGYWVAPFGDRQIALSRATHMTPGPKYLLEWPETSPEPACALHDKGVKVLAGWDTNLLLACVTDPTLTSLKLPGWDAPRPMATQCCEPANGTCHRFLDTNDHDGCIAGHGMQAQVSPMTWQEAANKCHSIGLTLCDQACVGEGCGYNANPVWTNLPC